MKENYIKRIDIINHLLETAKQYQSQPPIYGILMGLAIQYESWPSPADVAPIVHGNQYQTDTAAPR